MRTTTSPPDHVELRTRGPSRPRRRVGALVLFVALLLGSTAASADVLRDDGRAGPTGRFGPIQREEPLAELEPYVPEPLVMEHAMPEPDAPVDDWTPNEFGCLRDCIVEALIHPHPRFPSFELAVETTVATHAQLWVAYEEPNWVDGVPIMNGWPNAHSSSAGHTWTGEVDGLEYGESYFLALLVIDQQGNHMFATTNFTLPDRAADLTAEGSPCYFGCIGAGHVYAGPTFETVELEVETDGAVDVEVRVSPQEPGTIGGHPFLPADQPFVVTSDSGGTLRGTVSDLEPDTTYHVVVSATDAEGFAEHATGSFRSGEAPDVEVDVAVLKFSILEDGDPTTLGGKGEIELAWGLRSHRIWHYDGEFSPWKLEDGDSVSITDELYTATVSVPYGEPVPEVGLTARERDTPLCGGSFLDTTGLLGGFPEHSIMEYGGDACGTTLRFTNVILEPTLDELEAAPDCSHFGVVGARADWKCLVTGAGGHDAEWVWFTAVVGYDLP
ncbi:MAG: hypothetical protein AAFZ07_00090 [Actinomycetota bacterium]